MRKIMFADNPDSVACFPSYDSCYGHTKRKQNTAITAQTEPLFLTSSGLVY